MRKTKNTIKALFMTALLFSLVTPAFAQVFARPTVYGSQPGRKIDNEPVDGISGVRNSLAYKVSIIESHLHCNERWFEAAATPSGETHVADRICTGGGSFQVDAGNNNWGAWLQILGSSDTPEVAGSAFYNLHRLVFLDHESNGVQHCIQIAFGDSGAAALAAGDFTEIVLLSGGGNSESPPVEIRSPRISSGTKAWIRIRVPGEDTSTLDFVFGIHEFSN